MWHLASCGLGSWGYVVSVSSTRARRHSARTSCITSGSARSATLATGMPKMPPEPTYNPSRRKMSTQARKQRETAHTVMLAGLVGSELMTTIGLTNRYQLFTPKHMLLDDDLSHRAANAFRDLELNDETLALDVIDAVGPGGHLLAQAHTRRHMKETVERSIGQQIGPDGVHYRDPLDVAPERGVAILEGYRPGPLDEDKQRELRRVVEAADAELRD